MYTVELCQLRVVTISDGLAVGAGPWCSLLFVVNRGNQTHHEIGETKCSDIDRSCVPWHFRASDSSCLFVFCPGYSSSRNNLRYTLGNIYCNQISRTRQAGKQEAPDHTVAEKLSGGRAAGLRRLTRCGRRLCQYRGSHAVSRPVITAKHDGKQSH